MATVQEMQKKFYTKEGLIALKAKLATAVRFYNEEEKKPVSYPFSHQMLGFEKWEVETKEELLSRIKELLHIIGGGQLKEEIIVEKIGETETRTTKLRYSI